MASIVRRNKIPETKVVILPQQNQQKQNVALSFCEMVRVQLSPLLFMVLVHCCLIDGVVTGPMMYTE